MDAALLSEFSTNTLVFYVNGKRVEDCEVDPRTTLAVYLRDHLHLKGTKIGCSEGGCGACTVMVSDMVVDPESTSSRTQSGELVIRNYSVNSCLTPVCSVFGKAVTTVEGVGSVRSLTKRRMHPVQERLADAHGSQCGYCTPGFVMAMYTLLRNNPTPTRKEVDECLQGNLCRCTGYRPILEAFYSFVPPSAEGTAVSNGAIGYCGRVDGCCRGRKMGNSDSIGSENVAGELNDSSNRADQNSNCLTLGSKGFEDDLIGINQAPNDLKQSSNGLSLGSNALKEGFKNGPESIKNGLNTLLCESTDLTTYPSGSNHAPTGCCGLGSDCCMSQKLTRFDLSAPYGPPDPTAELIFLTELHSLHGVSFTVAKLNESREWVYWLRPTSLHHLLELKRRLPGARLVAGNTEVGVESKFRFVPLPIAVDVKGVGELRSVTVMPEWVELGAGLSLNEAKDVLGALITSNGRPEIYGVLNEVVAMLHYFAGKHIRNMATIVGNIATASPISDLNPIWMASGAEVVLAHSTAEGSQIKSRVAPIDSNFFLGYRRSVIAPEEVMTAIRIPLLASIQGKNIRLFRAYKQAQRREDDIAIVTGAFYVELSGGGEGDGDKKIKELRIAYGGMAPTTKMAVESIKEGVIGRGWKVEFLEG